MLRHTTSTNPANGPSRPRPTFTEADKLANYTQQKGHCNGCKRKYELKDMHMDHIKPISEGGSDKPRNLQLLCGNCNSTKNNGTMKQLEERLIAKGVLKAPPKPKSSRKQQAGTAKKAATKATAKQGPSKTRKR